MEKSLNPLQESSTFNLSLSIILWARDTIPTFEVSEDFELLGMYSVLKIFYDFQIITVLNLRIFSSSSDFIMDVYCVS